MSTKWPRNFPVEAGRRHKSMPDVDWAQQYGPWALIAGAAEGMGRVMAERFAQHNTNLFLLDHNTLELDKLAHHLAKTSEARIETLAIDLASPDAFARIQSMTGNRDIGFYAHIACAAPLGEFAKISGVEHEAAINLNVVLASRLAHFVAGGMIERRRGGIVFCGSMASLSGFPYNAQYSACKAYLKNIGEALWYELKPYNVHVLTAVISEVTTPSFRRHGSKARGMGRTLTPEQGVDEIFSALGKYPSRVTGFWNRLDGFLLEHVLPKELKLKILSDTIQRRFMN